MVRIPALIIRSQWVPDSSDRKGRRAQEVEGRTVGKGSRCKGPGEVYTSYVGA